MMSPQLSEDTQADSTPKTQVALTSSDPSSDQGQFTCPLSNKLDNDVRPSVTVLEQLSSTNTTLSAREDSTQNPISGGHIPTGKRSNQEIHDHVKTSSQVCAFSLASKDGKTQLPASQGHDLKRSLVRLKRTSIPILLCLASIGLLATVIIYVHSTYAAESSSSRGLPLSDLLKTDVSKTLTVLRTSQGILSALTSLALENIFFLLQWSQIHPPNGLSYLRILALSPTTGGIGTLNLLKSSAPNLPTKCWALLR